LSAELSWLIYNNYKDFRHPAYEAADMHGRGFELHGLFNTFFLKLFKVKVSVKVSVSISYIF